jgi:hypothetical protein
MSSNLLQIAMPIHIRMPPTTSTISLMGGDYNPVSSGQEGIAVTMVWAAPCSKCKKVSGVRKSLTGTMGIEFPHPSRKTLVKCRHCGQENEFSDGDLIEVDASILGEEEKSEESTTFRPDTPSGSQ